MATNTLPGLEELYQDLLQNKKGLKYEFITKNQPIENRVPSTTTGKYNTNAVQRGGVFTPDKAIKYAPAAARMGTGATGAMTLLPIATSAGEGLGRIYNEMTGQADDQGYFEGNPDRVKRLASQREASKMALPDFDEKGNSLPPKRQMAQSSQLSPDFSVRQNDQPGVRVQNSNKKVQQERPADNVLDFVGEEAVEPVRLNIPPMGDGTAEAVEDLGTVEAELMPTDDQEPVQPKLDPQLEQILALLQAPVQTIPQEEIDPKHTKRIDDLTTPVGERSQRKIGGWERFWKAGMGRMDWNRADKLEEERHQLRNQYTEREKAGLAHSSDQVSGAQNFNRQARIQDFQKDEAGQRLKFMTDVLAGDRSRSQTGDIQSRLQQEGSQLRREEAKDGYRAQSLTPEQQATKLRSSLIEKNAGLLPIEELEELMGTKVNPEAYQALVASMNQQKATNPLEEVMAEYIAQQWKIKRGGAGAAQPAAEKGKPRQAPNQKEATLNLGALQQ